MVNICHICNNTPNERDATNNHDHFICNECMSDAFPFNNLENDLLGTQFPRDRTNDVDYDGMASLNEQLMLNVANLNDDGISHLLDNIDPDINFYDHRAQANLTSDYFNENKFNIDIVNRIAGHQTLSLLHLNIRSVPKNLNDLKAYVASLNVEFTVIGLSETWISDSNVGLYGIEGYSMEEVHRSNRTGGGVSIYIKNSYKYVRKYEFDGGNQFFESVFIDVKGSTSNNNILVGVVYRPPRVNMEDFMNSMSTLLENLSRLNRTVYIMGDFNINLINANNNNITSEFVDLMFSYSFSPLINKPTRVTSTSATLIDNIFCNNINNSQLVNGIMYTDISDHFPIFTIIINENPTHKTVRRTRRIYSEKNIENFHRALQSIDWLEVISITNCHDAFTKFHKLYTNCYEANFPIVESKTTYRERKPWLTSGIKRSIKEKKQIIYYLYKTSICV